MRKRRNVFVIIALIVILAIFIGCEKDSTSPNNSNGELEGTWIGADDEGNPVTMSFNGSVCDFALSENGTVYSTFNADFQINSNENPKEIDMTITSSIIDGEIDTAVGISPLGIYKIVDDVLTIYSNIVSPRPTSFVVGNNENKFMFVILTKQ